MAYNGEALTKNLKGCGSHSNLPNPQSELREQPYNYRQRWSKSLRGVVLCVMRIIHIGCVSCICINICACKGGSLRNTTPWGCDFLKSRPFFFIFSPSFDPPPPSIQNFLLFDWCSFFLYHVLKKIVDIYVFFMNKQISITKKISFHFELTKIQVVYWGTTLSSLHTRTLVLSIHKGLVLEIDDLKRKMMFMCKALLYNATHCWNCKMVILYSKYSKKYFSRICIIYHHVLPVRCL